jgi:hypothetical protein
MCLIIRTHFAQVKHDWFQAMEQPLYWPDLPSSVYYYLFAKLKHFQSSTKKIP